MIEFKLLRRFQAPEFEAEVQHHLNKGWTLNGGTFLANPGTLDEIFCQAVIKDSPEKKFVESPIAGKKLEVLHVESDDV